MAEAEGQPGGRKAIAASICEAWDWRQPRGTLATRACVDLLLRLEEWGHIELPPVRQGVRRGPRRPKHPVLPSDLVPLTGLEIRGTDVDLSSLVVRPIAPEEREGWRLYMERYHYLGYRPIVGEHLLYAAFLQDELVALLGWGSAAFRAPLREAYIGWDDAAKREHLHLVANNVRFLVLPWVRVPHLASKVLATNLCRLSEDWEQQWGHPIHLAETFVDTSRFRGTCYRASNWLCLGQTAGRTKRGNAYLHEGASKAIFVYPLHRQTQRLLGGGPRAVAAPAAGLFAPGGEELEPSNVIAPSTVIAENDQGPVEVIGSPSPSSVSDGAKRHRGASLKTVTSALAALAIGGEGTALDLFQIADAVAIVDGASPVAQMPGREAPCGRLLGKATPRGPGTNKTRLQIEPTDAERKVLEQQARGLAVPHRTVIRSKILLLLAAGETISAAARKVGTDRGTVRKWGERFVRKRLAGLEDADRSGRPARFSPRSRNSPGEASLPATRHRGPLSVAVDLRGTRARFGTRGYRRHHLAAVSSTNPALPQAQALESSPLAQLEGAAGCRLPQDSAQYPGPIHPDPPAP